MTRIRVVPLVVGSVVVVVLLVATLVDSEMLDFLGGQVHGVMGFVRRHGQASAVALLYLEESGIPMPLPGDGFVMFVGHRVRGSWPDAVVAWLAIIAAVVLGATNLYLVSRRWGRRLAEGRLGRAFHVTPARLERAERWFMRWGALALILGRHIPGMRVPITVAAGAFRVSYAVFAASVAVSTATWAAFFLAVGAIAGPRVGTFLGLHRSVTPTVLGVVLVAMVAYAAFRWRRVDVGASAPRDLS